MKMTELENNKNLKELKNSSELSIWKKFKESKMSLNKLENVWLKN